MIFLILSFYIWFMNRQKDSVILRSYVILYGDKLQHCYGPILDTRSCLRKLIQMDQAGIKRRVVSGRQILNSIS